MLENKTNQIHLSPTESKPVTEDEAYWAGHVFRFKQSGLSKIDFCRKHSLCYHKFKYQYYKLTGKARLSTQSQDRTKPPLIPIEVSSAQSSPSESLRCQLSLPGGKEIRIYNNALAESLMKVLVSCS